MTSAMLEKCEKNGSETVAGFCVPSATLKNNGQGDGSREVSDVEAEKKAILRQSRRDFVAEQRNALQQARKATQKAGMEFRKAEVQAARRLAKWQAKNELEAATEAETDAEWSPAPKRDFSPGLLELQKRVERKRLRHAEAKAATLEREKELVQARRAWRQGIEAAGQANRKAAREAARKASRQAEREARKLNASQGKVEGMALEEEGKEVYGRAAKVARRQERMKNRIAERKAQKAEVLEEKENHKRTRREVKREMKMFTHLKRDLKMGGSTKVLNVEPIVATCAPLKGNEVSELANVAEVLKDLELKETGETERSTKPVSNSEKDTKPSESAVKGSTEKTQAGVALKKANVNSLKSKTSNFPDDGVLMSVSAPVKPGDGPFRIQKTRKFGVLKVDIIEDTSEKGRALMSISAPVKSEDGPFRIRKTRKFGILKVDIIKDTTKRVSEGGWEVIVNKNNSKANHDARRNGKISGNINECIAEENPIKEKEFENEDTGIVLVSNSDGWENVAA